jgi:predicted AAA+ superfamily ATPase
MRPLCLFERAPHGGEISLRSLLAGEHPKISGACRYTLTDYVGEIIAGGFPGMRHLSGKAASVQLGSYLDRIVDHDLPEAGYGVRRPATVMAWMRAYAAASATTASWEKVRDAATSGTANKPAKTTTGAYTELLTALRIFDPLDAWLPTRNHLTRLASAPKHHMADPALAVRLLRLSGANLLSGATSPLIVDGTLLGALFESLVALSVRTFAQAADAATYHLRTQAGRHEVDCIVERDGAVVALEVQLSGSVEDSDVRHLNWLETQIGADLVERVVVTTGGDAYRRKDGVAVIPLGLLGP